MIDLNDPRESNKIFLSYINNNIIKKIRKKIINELESIFDTIFRY